MDEDERKAYLRNMVRRVISENPELRTDPWFLADTVIHEWMMVHPNEPIDEDHVMQAMFEMGMSEGGMEEPS